MTAETCLKRFGNCVRKCEGWGGLRIRGKANEWIAIADLMSGVVAVVMLLLVVSVLQRTTEAAGDREQQEKISRLLVDLERKIQRERQQNLVKIDQARSAILLTAGFFPDGSACVGNGNGTSAAEGAIQLIWPAVKMFLANNPGADVLVEGHTNSVPVTDLRKRAIQDAYAFKTRYCSQYDDQFTLSAARAREVRQKILDDSHLNSKEAARIIVAGYGDSRPIDVADLTADQNKRVEIILRIRREADK